MIEYITLKQRAVYLCNRSSFISRYAFGPRPVLTLAISDAVGRVSGFFTILQCSVGRIR